MKKIIPALIFLLCAVMLASGCSQDQNNTGIVARVNDRPITLERLQVRYDFKKLSIAADNPSVAALKKEYGGILSDILVEELVAQDLEALDLGVTSEEVAAAEAEIRVDYPEGAFEEVLVEEYIDIDSWRQELRARLTMEKFFREVLRPGITIGYEEAEAYYREHIQEFYLPSRVRFSLVSSPSRDAIVSAMKQYRHGERIEDQAGKFDRVSVRDIRMREDRLTVTWKNALKGLKSGEASSVLTAKGGYEVLIYLETIPAKILDPSQAYPVVERVLLDNKLREAFDHWLSDALATAVISVSPHLPLEIKNAGRDMAGAAQPEDESEISAAENATAP